MRNKAQKGVDSSNYQHTWHKNINLLTPTLALSASCQFVS